VKDLRDKQLNILFRADSSASIGLGHIMRCLVLATRLKNEQKNINIIFATQELQGNINSKILQDGFKLHILKSNKKSELLKLLAQKSIDLLIIDSYKIDSKYEKEIIHKTTSKVLVFDDIFIKHYSNMVLNHGLQVQKKDYKGLVTQKTKVLCGPNYTILRDEFFKNYKKTDTTNKIAIILGGNDIKNLSLKIAKLLQKIDKRYKVSIITTSVNPNLKKLQNIQKINLLVDIKNVAQTLCKQELIICASGGNLFEVMALKKRFINIKIAKNQDNIVEFLEKKKVFTTLDLKEINKTNLEDKINYTATNNIYNILDFKFSKSKLARKILSEIQ